MPLSKKRNRDRMKVKRATCVQPNVAGEEALKRVIIEIVQPESPFNEGSRYNPSTVDADGNPIYEEG